MCGIGVLFSKNTSQSIRNEIGYQMAQSIRHRGPDAQEVWSSETGLTLVHARLSILDLSPTGRQPMASASGKWMIVFNGEVYNHTEIRSQYLSDHKFRGTSDTETLVELIERLGPIEAIQKTRGMFAIAAFDIENQALHLLRDRIGEKPLYYGFIGNDFVVGSELKVFACHPKFDKQIDLEALHQFLRFNYVPQPLSIFKSVKKLPQGSHLQLNLKTNQLSKISQYWQVPFSSEKTSTSEKTFADYQSELEKKLLEVVQIQMRSDVPYGCFLSGGVDSSAIAALMQTQSKQPIKTFSIGFNEMAFNEAPFAKRVAQHLGSDHSEWILSSEEAKKVIPHLPHIYDEPFADSSQIPTYLLSKMTRSKVTVSLSGDGGDELLCGYNRYDWSESVWNWIRLFPSPLKKWLSSPDTKLPATLGNSIYQMLLPALPRSLQFSHFEGKLQKALSMLNAKSGRDIFFKTLVHWQEPSDVMKTKTKFPIPDQDAHTDAKLKLLMMWHDQSHYLPDDIMVKVDRASMAVSLETRAPFLDHELIETVAAMPADIRIGQIPKELLKAVLYKHVPKDLVERPKMGFGIPMRAWLKDDFKSMTLDLLSPERIEKQGLFETDVIAKILTEFYEQGLPRENVIWPLVVFQLWHTQWFN